eukprot:scaffold4781_cov339-Prasinococcus_capsulatus_cf.AAC.7
MLASLKRAVTITVALVLQVPPSLRCSDSGRWRRLGDGTWLPSQRGSRLPISTAAHSPCCICSMCRRAGAVAGVGEHLWLHQGRGIQTLVAPREEKASYRLTRAMMPFPALTSTAFGLPRVRANSRPWVLVCRHPNTIGQFLLRSQRDWATAWGGTGFETGLTPVGACPADTSEGDRDRGDDAILPLPDSRRELSHAGRRTAALQSTAARAARSAAQERKEAAGEVSRTPPPGGALMYTARAPRELRLSSARSEGGRRALALRALGFEPKVRARSRTPSRSLARRLPPLEGRRAGRRALLHADSLPRLPPLSLAANGYLAGGLEERSDYGVGRGSAHQRTRS